MIDTRSDVSSFRRLGRFAPALALVALGATLAFAQAPAGDGKPAAAGADTAKPAEAAKAAAPAKPALARPPAPVTVAQVAVKPMPAVLDVVGTAQAMASVPLKTRVDSMIDKVLVKEGDRVQAGQGIFQLDDRAVKAQVAQARAVLARDEAQLALLRSDLERTEQLVQTKTKSNRDLESAKTLVAAQMATIEADRAALQNLEVQASWYVISSPIAGRVGSIALKAGSAIRANDSSLLATVNQLDPIYVAFSVPQASIPALRAAMAAGDVTVAVHQPNVDGAPLSGRIAYIENMLDAASGTLGVKAVVDNPAERLLPGEFVQVRAVLRTDPNALVVPDQAIQLGQNGTFVYVVKDDATVEARRVTIDRTVDRVTVIAKGLAAGEKVVVDGQLRLFPGASVVTGKPAESGGKPNEGGGKPQAAKSGT
ncbi:efflux RND transporter periplasmic adaptor subunit [Pinisolibacter sp.]|uniref:efflux RND transporter periplasmic adaptor subunit n=1 Tax=Pinisolibacter sp. TaxID=2172024 RepID=UPI002FDE37D3